MTDPDRLREHPADRLASAVRVVDLPAEADRLRAEAHAPVGGHRQIAVVRDEGLTVILFAFEAGGHLKEHRADGSVIIQLLQGRLVVEAEGTRHELEERRLVALAPGTMHSVHAPGPATMLLTVSRPRD